MVLSVTDFKKAFGKNSPSKPNADLFFSASKRTDKEDLQNEIANASPAKAQAIIAKLADSDSKFAGELAAYKLHKHRNDPQQWAKYLLSIPRKLWTDDHRKQLMAMDDFDWFDQTDWGKEILAFVKELPDDKQVEMLTRKDGHLYKLLETNVTRVDFKALNIKHSDALGESFGISAKDQSAIKSSLAKGPFDMKAAQKNVDAIVSKNEKFARFSMAQRLDDAKGDRVEWTKVFLASKPLWKFDDFAIPALGADGDFSWLKSKGQAKELVETLLEQPGGHRAAWLKNSSFLNKIEEIDPAGFKEMIEAIPQLKAVYGVRNSLKKSKHDPSSKEYLKQAADGIIGSILDDGDSALKGFSYLADAGRAGRVPIEDWLTGTAEGDTGGPCSVLTNIAMKLVQTWPGPGELKFGVDEIIPPVMTRPLKDIDPNGRGMVTRGFSGKAGNVYEGGKLSGRVFFSGGGTGAAHTWVTINDVPYDTLFGTSGGDVAKAVDEKFDQDMTNPDLYIGKTTGRRLIRDRTLTNPGESMGFASYRLEKAGTEK